MPTNKILQLNAALIFFFVLFNSANAGSELRITQAWIPEAPPVAKVMAGYLTIENTTKHAVKLLSVSSPDFARIEMHKTVTKEGMARMIKQQSLSVPANGKLEFKRGGLHLMLLDKKRTIKSGDKVTLTLQTNLGKVKVVADVKQASLEDQQEHHHHHH